MDSVSSTTPSPRKGSSSSPPPGDGCGAEDAGAKEAEEEEEEERVLRDAFDGNKDGLNMLLLCVSPLFLITGVSFFLSSLHFLQSN